MSFYKIKLMWLKRKYLLHSCWLHNFCLKNEFKCVEKFLCSKSSSNPCSKSQFENKLKSEGKKKKKSF